MAHPARARIGFRRAPRNYRWGCAIFTAMKSNSHRPSLHRIGRTLRAQRSPLSRSSAAGAPLDGTRTRHPQRRCGRQGNASSLPGEHQIPRMRSDHSATLRCCRSDRLAVHLTEESTQNYYLGYFSDADAIRRRAILADDVRAQDDRRRPPLRDECATSARAITSTS